MGTYNENDRRKVKEAIAVGDFRSRISSRAMQGLEEISKQHGLDGNILELLERIGIKTLKVSADQSSIKAEVAETFAAVETREIEAILRKRIKSGDAHGSR